MISELKTTLNGTEYMEIHGKGCYITIEPRPPYCDRGNYVAKVFTKYTAPQEDIVYIDAQDMFPRYYFNMKCAMVELVAWLFKRNQWTDVSKWVKKGAGHEAGDQNRSA